jgi:NAD(P) transhydrogenase subunit beta
MSDADVLNVINAAYVVSAALFILGIQGLRKPSTARRGNLTAAAGMFIAVLATFFDRDIEAIGYVWIVIGLVAGAALGTWFAQTVPMTGMPQMVAVFNALGGAASALVAGAELIRLNDEGFDIDVQTSITIGLSCVIGAVTLTGSFVAAGKLQGSINQNPILIPARNAISAIVAAITVGLLVYLVVDPSQEWTFLAMLVAALLAGILVSIPIGGADMPVLVTLLNSYSGLAAAAAGFVLGNNLLIVTGALVGASGLILTNIMTRAMNRSAANVIFAGFGESGASVKSAEGLTYREVNAEDAAVRLAYARSCVFVTGYGLAVAQAQHEIRSLADLLQDRGCDVKYGIHPVAGRMPGHMNVLLAEADVPYDQLYDLEAINRELDQTEIAIVVGANDVVNPAARTDSGSPIYGMPILDVDKAQSVIVMKRSMASGFAGIDNELFYMPQTSMLFGNAKVSLKDLVAEVEEISKSE